MSIALSFENFKDIKPCNCICEKSYYSNSIEEITLSSLCKKIQLVFSSFLKDGQLGSAQLGLQKSNSETSQLRSL